MLEFDETATNLILVRILDNLFYFVWKAFLRVNSQFQTFFFSFLTHVHELYKI